MITLLTLIAVAIIGFWVEFCYRPRLDITVKKEVLLWYGTIGYRQNIFLFKL